jgi:hypothetical protein
VGDSKWGLECGARVEALNASKQQQMKGHHYE